MRLVTPSSAPSESVCQPASDAYRSHALSNGRFQDFVATAGRRAMSAWKVYRTIGLKTAADSNGSTSAIQPADPATTKQP